jgi:2-amino-4-hydroxy-6-hydroxymethyldihydropteridine diphosphokinase
VSERVYIGLGSNIGDREDSLRRAVEAMSRIDAVAVLRRSSLYDTAPIGPAQHRFLNAVVEIEAGLAPPRLFSILKQIERDLGRVETTRWAPRLIDLDILLWVGRLIAEPNLQVPHLEMHQRRFVLEPLCELAPELRHPVLDVTMAQLLAGSPRQDVVRVASPDWQATDAVEEEAR